MEEKAGSSPPETVMERYRAGLDQYFQYLIDNKPLYVAVALTQEQRVKVYFEHLGDVSVCRIFFSAEDAATYITHLNAKGVDTKLMRSWESTPDTLATFMNTTGTSFAASKNRSATALVTVRSDGWWRTFDVFWSNEPRLVV